MFDGDPQLLLGPSGAVRAEAACGFTYDEARSSPREAASSSAVRAFKVGLALSVIVLARGKLRS